MLLMFINQKHLNIQKCKFYWRFFFVTTYRIWQTHSLIENGLLYLTSNCRIQLERIYQHFVQYNIWSNILQKGTDKKGKEKIRQKIRQFVQRNSFNADRKLSIGIQKYFCTNSSLILATRTRMILGYISQKFRVQGSSNYFIMYIDIENQ